MVNRKTFQVLGSVTLLILCSWGLNAQENPAAARMRALNNAILGLHGQMQRAAPNEAALLHSQAAKVIEERAAALSALIQQDARQGLSFAFSPELLADLAAKFPKAASQLESHRTVSGPIEHWIIDNVDKTSRSLFRMKVGQQTLNLYFAYHEPPNLKSGDVAQATGVVVGNDMAVSTSSTVQPSAASTPTSTTSSTVLHTAGNFVREQRCPILVLLLSLVVLAALGLAPDICRAREHIKQFAIYVIAFAVFVSSSSTSFAQTSTSACSTRGVQNTVVLLVTFPGVTPPVTSQAVHDVFFGTTGHSLDGFWREASYGQTYASGDVYGWYTLSGSYSSCMLGTALNDAMAAASASGANFQNYSRVFLVFPDTIGCGWAGYATVGCTTLNSPNGSVTASIAYLVAGYLSNRDQGVELVSHEGGHNLGLLHAGTIDDRPQVLGPLSSPGTANEMGDYWSTMGSWTLGLYSAPHKAEVLTWMASGTNYQVVQNSGTYTLQPLEISPPGQQALKVQRGTGNKAWLWVEYRQPLGNYDSTLLTQPFSGALVHYEDPTVGAFTKLLDFTPDTSSWYDPALAVGQTWVDAYTNVSLSIQSATSSGLTVSVNYGAAPCTHANPSMTVTPLNPSIYPGNSASYAISVTNNDAAGCASSTYNLGSTRPSGWPTSFSATALTLNPGQSGSATMGKTGPMGTPPGTYGVDANAANGSFAASGTANVTVMTPPSLGVSVSVSGSSFTFRQSASFTAKVLNGSTPAAGASVTFTLTKANGSKVTQTATADSTGTATWSYRIGQKDPQGTYSAVAQATFSSQTATSNTATFTVQ